MSAPLLLLLAVGAGALIPLQTALNAQLGRVVGHPVLTTGIVFGSGVVASAIVAVVVRPAWPPWSALHAVPPAAWLGGTFGMIYIVLLVFLAPRLGVGLATALVLVGQLTTALALDHFGGFGAARHAINLFRLAGVALMCAGVYLIKSHE